MLESESVPLPEWWPALFPPPFAPVPPSDMPAWPDDAATRRLALSLGEAHADAVASLRRLGATHGGGLFGVVKGVLAEYERLGYLTAMDGRRIIACCEAFEQAGGGTHSDRQSAAQVIQDQYEEAIADPYSTPFCLQVLSVAASGGGPMADRASDAEVGAADFTAAFFGGGLLGAAIASGLVAHLDVHVTFS